MNLDIARYRDFARRCREMSKTSRDHTAVTLVELADDYDARADELERLQGRPEPRVS